MASSQSQTAIPLYQTDESLRTLETPVLATSELSSLSEQDLALFKKPPENAFVVTTAQTIFYAQGGGQPSDSGTMQTAAPHPETTFHVHIVRSSPSTSQILHLGTFSPLTASPFPPNLPITQFLDAKKRDLHNRLHTAGHILGLAIRRLSTRTPNPGIPVDIEEGKASHYPSSACVECRGLVEGRAKDAIQAETDFLVSQRFPVKICWWGAEEAKSKGTVGVDEVVAGLKEGQGLRVVDIEGVGSYPCGGTHVKDTGEVGKVVVKKIKRQNGVSKVSYGVE